MFTFALSVTQLKTGDLLSPTTRERRSGTYELVRLSPIPWRFGSPTMGGQFETTIVERWTRTGPDTIELVATMDDPTVWTRPWTIVQDFKLQSNEANLIYYEPRCHEGNYGLPGLLAGARAEEKAFAEGSRPPSGHKVHHRMFLI